MLTLLGIGLTAAVGCSTAEPGTEVPDSPASTPTTTALDPTATPAPSATVTAEPTPTAGGKPDFSSLPPDQRSVAERLWLSYSWNTDFTKKTVDLTEIRTLLPRDQIVPIDEPTFADASSPPDYLDARQPVIALEINGDARAYPLDMLMWHEIVNDTVGGKPVTITFCPLCNSALVFDRVVGGEELTFGTTGALRHSDLIMWDRQTESWWQQITGNAIAGHYAADETRLDILPSAVVAWDTFVETHPDGRVLERKFDSNGIPIRRYDLPPYAGYDSVDNTDPFAFEGEVDGRLPAAARVLAIEHDGAAVAYPYSYLESNPVVNDSIGDLEFVAIFDTETLSAFVDIQQNEQASGSVAAFNRNVDGQLLEFSVEDGQVVDDATGSTWNAAGLATSGPMEGTKLEPIVYGEHFWFAWAVFRPETEVRGRE